jgi:hypothetical protein
MAATPTPDPGQVTINQTINRQPINTDPQTVHELITRQMVVELREEVREVRNRVNGLIFTVVGAVVVQLVLIFGGFVG